MQSFPTCGLRKCSRSASNSLMHETLVNSILVSGKAEIGFLVKLIFADFEFEIGNSPPRQGF